MKTLSKQDRYEERRLSRKSTKTFNPDLKARLTKIKLKKLKLKEQENG